MIRQVIFDIGNVLLDFKPLEYLKEKIKDPQKIREVYEALFQSEEWVLLDRGTISEAEAKNNILTRHPHLGSLIELAFAGWVDMMKPIEGTIGMVKILKQAGYGVYFLSNFQMLAFEEVWRRNEFFGLFDGGIVSYKEKRIKPEEEIYRKLLTEYGLEAEESVFIDDMPVNVEGAGKLGIKGIVFQNPMDCRRQLIGMGVEI